MAQSPQNKPRSIQEMLESAPQAPAQEMSELEQLKLELAKKDKLIEQQQEALGQTQEKIEGTPIVSKDQLSGIVENVHQQREIKEQIENTPSAENEQKIHEPGKGQAAQAQKAVIKQSLADDIAFVSEIDRPKQVKSLVLMALQRGLHYSYDVAKGMNDPHLLDEFHDALAVEMRDLLCKQKKLKDC